MPSSAEDASLDPQEMLAAVRQLDPPQRRGALLRMCRDDGELYSTLSNMLDAIDGPPIRLPETRLKNGASLDQYQIRGELGRGTTATVYRAYDRRTGRHVALKVFNASASRRRLKAVVGEAQATARIDSEFVVRVHGTSPLEADVPYLDLELCGEDTTTTLRGYRPARLDEALLLIEQVARGVHAAHERGVFHRDIKPDNILIEKIGSRHRAKVTDFGLASTELAAEESNEDELATRTISESDRGVFRAGTPAYMAPEMARGTDRRLDPIADKAKLTQIDVYAIGATLYQILRGEEPYRSRPNSKNPVFDVLKQIDEGPPLDLRAASCHIRAPRRLRKVVNCAIARDVSRRYTSALALADDLRALRELRPTTLDRGLGLRLWIRRNHLTSIGIVVMLVAIGVALYFGGYAAEKRDEAEDAIATRDRAERAARQATQEAEGAKRAREQAELDARKKVTQADRVAKQSSADAADARLQAETASKDRSVQVRAARAALNARDAAEAKAAAADKKRGEAEAKATAAEKKREEDVGAAETKAATAEAKAEAAEKKRQEDVGAADAKAAAADTRAAAAEKRRREEIGTLEKKRQDEVTKASAAQAAAKMEREELEKRIKTLEDEVSRLRNERAKEDAKPVPPEHTGGGA